MVRFKVDISKYVTYNSERRKETCYSEASDHNKECKDSAINMSTGIYEVLALIHLILEYQNSLLRMI